MTRSVNTVMAKVLVSIVAGGLIAGLFGCLIGCSSPASRFYVLGDETLAKAAAAAAPGGFASSVMVHPAALPEVVDRPQLVVLAPGQQVVVLEQERWAEPLRSGIARYVAAQLSRLLGTPSVSSSEEVLRHPDYNVSIDVRRLDARPESAVDVEVLWRVRSPANELRMGHKRVREGVKGKGVAPIVAANARAFEAVSRDIAAAIASFGHVPAAPAAVQ